MKIFILFAFCLSILTATGCFRSDRRTVEFNVPQLKSQECLTYLSGKLRSADGVEAVEADLERGAVTVTFNGLKLALMNIEIIIAEAGFDVNDRPADEKGKASMPIPCR